MDSRLDDVAKAPVTDSLVPQDGFLFIGELAKLTSSDPKTIRFYERVELISPPAAWPFSDLSGE